MSGFYVQYLSICFPGGQGMTSSGRRIISVPLGASCDTGDTRAGHYPSQAPLSQSRKTIAVIVATLLDNRGPNDQLDNLSDNFSDH